MKKGMEAAMTIVITIIILVIVALLIVTVAEKQIRNVDESTEDTTDTAYEKIDDIIGSIDTSPSETISSKEKVKKIISI